MATGERPLIAYVKLARPKQWLKNVLVFAAPGAADVLLDAKPLIKTLIAFVAFCLAASSIYCFNDANDAEADRLHPKKKNRPIASGEISVRAGYIFGTVLMAAALAIGFAVRKELGAAVLGYIALTILYTYVFKEIAVLDLVAIAGGFVIRALAGAAAVDVPISNWFFIVTSFGSIFMAAGKRYAEVAETGDNRGGHRKVLDEYTREYLTFLRAVSAGIALVAYCLWAFERAEIAHLAFPWYQVSIFPFTIALFRYALDVDKGQGGAPEDVITGDKVLLMTGAVWAACFALGILGAR